ncbi:MAG: sugar nucleotide-binding protein, partial [Candidatus Thorarchaeota archaeon]|nr:sugar nucleotide-binding protein [Candidatus Thorarchaeota archaeon]
MLGRELVRLCGRQLPMVTLHAVDLPAVDISDAAATDGLIGRLAPTLVINAAAYTDVDGCERHQELAWAVNAEGPGNLARSCLEHGARLVQVSTDFVFDGRKRVPYVPGDAINPLSVYGRSKAEGERRVREALGDHVIVRTSWLFAAQGRNFVRTILGLAARDDELRVV